VPKRLPRSLGFKKYALQFDGTDDYVVVPDNPNLDITGSITIEVLMKPDAPAPDKALWLVKKSESDSGFEFAFSREPGKNNQFFLNWNPGTGKALWSSDNAVKVGEWNHLVGVYEHNVENRLYVNGELDTTRSVSGDIVPNDLDLTIAYPNYFPGQIALVRIYNRALSQAEIRWNMLNYHSPVRDGLVLFLYDRIVSDTWHDESGLGNDGTIHGAVRKELAMWEIRAELGL